MKMCKFGSWFLLLFAGIGYNTTINTTDQISKTTYILALDFDGIFVNTVSKFDMGLKYISMAIQDFFTTGGIRNETHNEIYHVRTPIFAMWDFVQSFYNQHKTPVLLWTNNPADQLAGKLAHCANEHNLTFKFDGIVTKDLFNVKKPKREYYLHAYDFTLKHLEKKGIETENICVVFVDDMVENVQAANEVAQEYDLNLKAVHFPTAQQGIFEIEALLT